MGTEAGGDGTEAARFDHEKLEVYRVAREFLVLATQLMAQKVPRELRAQLDRASTSILFNIGEGAGRMARADKRRFYAQYDQARALLLRIAQMLSRLSGGPRTT